MTKVLLVDRFFYPDLQATAVLLTDLVTELSKEFDMKVLCGPPSAFKENKPRADLEKSINVLPTFDFPKSSLVGRILNYIFFLIVAFFGVLFHEKVDVVVSQTSPPLLPFVVSVACLLRQFPYIYICQDLFPQTAIVSHQLKKNALTDALHALNESALKDAKRIVSIGRDMTERLLQERVMREKITQIPNWANLQEIKPVERNNSFSESQQFKKFVILYSGNFGLLQDFDFLLSIAKELQNEKEIEFVFVGGGGLYDTTCKKGEGLSNVRFLPYQDRSILSEVLGSADIHLVSLIEGASGYLVPSKIYSLLASGRPIIGLMDKSSEAARLIIEADCGVIFEGKNPQNVAQFIKTCPQNPSLKTWGNNARRFMEKSQFRENGIQKYKEVILETVKP